MRLSCQVEAEVSRLEELKASKMKDLVLKKKAELEELRRRTHLLAEANGDIEFAVEAIESGTLKVAKFAVSYHKKYSSQ